METANHLPEITVGIWQIESAGKALYCHPGLESFFFFFSIAFCEKIELLLHELP